MEIFLRMMNNDEQLFEDIDFEDDSDHNILIL